MALLTLATRKNTAHHASVTGTKLAIKSGDRKGGCAGRGVKDAGEVGGTGIMVLESIPGGCDVKLRCGVR